MPTRSPHICSCGRRVPSGERCSCKRVVRAEVDRRRPSARKRGYDSKWEKARAAYLLKHPLCVMCLVVGQRTPATVVDHKIPHRGDPVLFWNSENWQQLCDGHHNSAKQRAEKRAPK